MENRLIEGKESGLNLQPERSERYQHLYKLMLPYGSRNPEAMAMRKYRKYTISSMCLLSILLHFHPPLHNIPVSIFGPFS